MSTKKDRLWKWMLSEMIFSTHQVEKWGVENRYISADRVKRTLRRQGLLRKLSNEEKASQGWNCVDAVYVVISFARVA